MVGKRVKKKKMRLPAVMVLLAAMMTVLTTAGPRGAAADSPLGSLAEPAAESTVPAVRLVPAEMEEVLPETDDPPEPFAPVPEGGPVEDTYFENIAFLGDSRTQGFQLYSGLKTGTYYAAVGATVESVLPSPARMS